MQLLGTFVSDLALSYFCIASTVWVLSRFNPEIAEWRSWDSSTRMTLAAILGFELIHHLFSLRLLNIWEKGRLARESKKPDTDIVDDVTAATRDHTVDSSSLVANPLDPTRLPLLKPERRLLARPTVAWPTVFLALASVGSWLWILKAGSSGRIDPWGAWLGATVCTFLAFTPMHDAVHNAVCPRDRWLNDLIGTIASIPFLGAFRMFRVIHLMHHRHCNDQDSAPDGSSMDPDNWAGEGPLWQLPVRWGTVFLYYRVFLRRLSLWEGGLVSQSSKAKYTAVWFEFAIQLPVVAVIAWAIGNQFLGLIIGSLIAGSSYLMYVFDYLPHRPHVVPYRKDPYKSTSVVRAVCDGFLTLPLLGQNMHNIHHLYPYVPFYKYSQIWSQYQQELVARGTRVVPWLLWSSREEYFEELKAIPGPGQGRGKLEPHAGTGVQLKGSLQDFMSKLNS